MYQSTCPHCTTSFTAKNPLKKYCSAKCCNAVRDLNRRVPCGDCGELTWRPSHTRDPVCQPCRRKRPGYRDKSTKPPETWTCGSCGRQTSRPATRGQRPKYCDSCRETGRNWIPKLERMRVYRRDLWICGICTDPIDKSLIGTMSIWRPSLDHIIPRSHGGSDDPNNLRAAHFWCNAVLSDGRLYSEEDFHVDFTGSSRAT